MGQQQKQMSEQQKQKSEQNGQAEPNNPGETENDGTRDGQIPPVEVGDLQDREGRGRWGRLPRTVIEQMYDNGRRKLPEKYRKHLEEYFRRLPESQEQ